MSAIVVITGSTRGVGFSLAKALLTRGDRVVLHGRTQASVDVALASLRGVEHPPHPLPPSPQGEGELRRLVNAGGEGPSLLGIAVDLRDDDAPARLLEAALAGFGAVDAIVCNAGVGGPADSPAWELDPRDWREVIDVNLDAVVRCARTFLGWMTKADSAPGRGRLIVCSSGAARHPLPGKSAYATSKAALEGFVHAVTRDLEGTGVLIAGVTLPTLRTDMTAGRLSDDVWSQLPTSDTVAAALCFALHGPVDLVAGRILDAGRFARDPEAEALLNTPTAIRRPIVPMPPIRHGAPVSRHARDVIALDRLESPYGVAPAVRTALSRFADDPRIHMYPDEGYPSLRAAIAAEHAVAPSQVALGAGSTALLERTLRLFLRPGDLALASHPTWPVFDRLAATNGARIDHVFPFRIVRAPPANAPVLEPSQPLADDHEQSAGVGVGVVEIPSARQARHRLELPEDARYRSARLVYLVNPSMPAGCAIDEDAFAQLLSQLGPSTIVIVDEAYADYVDPAITPQALRASRWIDRTDRPVIVLRTFSKLHGLAGFRVGYALGSTRVIELLARLELPYEIAAASALVAEAALGDHAHVRRACEANRTERTRMSHALTRLGIDHLDTDASFLLVEPPGGEIAFHQALEARRMFLPRGPVLDGRYLLLPVSTPERNDVLLEVVHMGV